MIEAQTWDIRTGKEELMELDWQGCGEVRTKQRDTQMILKILSLGYRETDENMGENSQVQFGNEVGKQTCYM